jgi:hypothetical protein
MWTAATVKGRGIFWTTKLEYAPRVAWLLHYGCYPDNNACHTCDVPACVRWDHLYDGTQAENLADMVNKGRHIDVANNRKYRLTESQVLSIRSLYADGATQPALSKMFDIDKPSISRIVNRKSWKHLP